jgi:plasmid maintenance system antidote protein VapI
MKPIIENSNLSIEKIESDKIHIGKIIKELVKKQSISVYDFAEKISCTPRNAYKIFSKPSIDCSLMVRINKVLEQNLFVYYLSHEDIKELRNKERVQDQELYGENPGKTLSLAQKGASR